MNERRESVPGQFSLAQKRGSVLNARGRRASMFDPIDPTELQKALYQEKSVKYNSNRQKSFILF
jgi:hypothetical protein